MGILLLYPFVFVQWHAEEWIAKGHGCVILTHGISHKLGSTLPQ